jgi:hypothetical protein
MKTFLVNVAVLLVLLVLVILGPPLAFDLYRLVSPAHDPRASLPNYQGVGWAKKHFEEFGALRTVYQDFIGWRRAPFAGETITIDAQGYRRHPGSPEPARADVWVFGGSTIWGPGANDETTIPANIQRFSSKPTFNFGEAAYTAHQSYNLLMKQFLLGGRPKHVVFYDGANEVVIKCRTELTFYSAAQEATIRERLRGLGNSGSSALEAFAPTVTVLGKLAQRGSGSQAAHFDCDVNEAKRKLIAATLAMDWALARKLTEQFGATFHAVLQPVAYTGAPNLDHLATVRNDTLMRAQYDSVYSEIQRQLFDANVPYTDLRRAFDGKDLLYIDFAHVVPRGNEIIGKAIAELLR